MEQKLNYEENYHQLYGTYFASRVSYVNLYTKIEKLICEAKIDSDIAQPILSALTLVNEELKGFYMVIFNKEES